MEASSIQPINLTSVEARFVFDLIESATLTGSMAIVSVESVLQKINAAFDFDPDLQARQRIAMDGGLDNGNLESMKKFLNRVTVKGSAEICEFTNLAKKSHTIVCPENESFVEVGKDANKDSKTGKK